LLDVSGAQAPRKGHAASAVEEKEEAQGRKDIKDGQAKMSFTSWVSFASLG
jgi:hypothetical protein